MLELIFQGFLEWCYDMTLECWEFFSSTLLDIMSMDFAYLKIHIPILDEMLQVLVAVGWALLIGNLVFQAMRSMASGLGFEGEDPKLLFTRTFIFSFLLLASPQICEIGLTLTSRIMEALELPDAVNVVLVDESVFGALTVSWLLVIIFGVIIMFKVFRLLLEIAERYLILAMLTLTAPLAFAMGGSRSTSEIFTGWCRMFGSMCLLMVTHVIFFKMLLSVLSTLPSGVDVLLWMVLILSIVKVAKKADGIITRIGLNPAITGDALGRGLPGTLTYMVMRTATSKVARTVGKAASHFRTFGGGWAPGTSSGGSGGPWTGGPFTGGGGAQTSSQCWADLSTSARPVNLQQAAVQGIGAAQGSAAFVTGSQVPAQEYTEHVSAQERLRSQMYGGGTPPERKSAVPPGHLRSPSYIQKPPAGQTAGVAGEPEISGTVGTAAAPHERALAGAGKGHPKVSQTGNSHFADSSGTAGTAGRVSGYRAVRGVAQSVQEGSGTKRKSIDSENEYAHQTAGPESGAKSLSGMQRGCTPAPDASLRPAVQGPNQTRYTKRPTPESPSLRDGRQDRPAQQETAIRQRGGQAAVQMGSSGAHPGPAGTAAQEPPVQTRAGRSGHVSSREPYMDSQHPHPVQQESHPLPLTRQPVIKASTIEHHPGPAGIAPGQEPAEKMRQSGRMSHMTPETGRPLQMKTAMKGHVGQEASGRSARKRRRDEHDAKG